MSDRMTPIPFSLLMEWAAKDKFGQKKVYIANENNSRALFGRPLETPVGPAAGPHTQLAQNIVAAYVAGSRFFELKTVQILDGEDLPVAKPCIQADDEGYNCEWSTELYVPQALEEYIKAWFVLSVLAKEFGLGAMDGFQFNMSVGYDLEGIKSPKIDSFIEALKDATDTDVFKECKAYLLAHVNEFSHVTAEDIETISPHICNSVTLSTLHGCPPQEIERIATYLLEEKGLHTFIKCNPTLLGYEFARETLDTMGYNYIAFGKFHFENDLQYADAVVMLQRLMALAERKHLEFGVKITNTFPVDVKQNELPSEEMYMSGKALYPLSIALAAKLAKEFDGKLRISYSGGADYYNIKSIVGAGIWPVTVATTLLKPGGYQRMLQLAEETADENIEFTGVDSEKARVLAEKALLDKHHRKPVKPNPSRKMNRKVPLEDCFIAPCKEGCPIHQDITAYMNLTGEGRYKEALEVITEKNPLPFITGTICAHNCMSKCTRNFYEEPIAIRSTKLEAAKGGFKEFMECFKNPETTGKKVAVVGGGPAGLSAAFFLAKGGMEVTLFEKEERLGGVVRNVIPGFRIPDSAIDHDIRIVEAMGVCFVTGKSIENVDELFANYEDVVLAIGATVPGVLSLTKGMAINALEFLAEFKKTDGQMDIGKRVVVIGGGNTAMDTARAAVRTDGVEKVSLVYRRTKRYMPADAEELEMAIEDGVEFAELLSPVSFENGILTCKKMILGDFDASGRRAVIDTEEFVEILADTVIAAVGEKTPAKFYEKNGIEVDTRGRAVVEKRTLATSKDHVYVAGDGVNGPATVVEAIRDGRKVAEAITGKVLARDFMISVEEEEIYDKRGLLQGETTIHHQSPESMRCLNCDCICENCVEVCPNRANLSINVGEGWMHQIVHVDSMCNECGNCETFCPYDSAPYRDKFTLFASEKDMADSTNQGFVILDREAGKCKIRLNQKEILYTIGEETKEIPEGIIRIVVAIVKDYPHVILR